MYIEERIEITKADRKTVGQVNGQIIYGHGYSFWQQIIDKKLSYGGKITHQRLGDVALVEDYEHCDTEGGPAVLVYLEDEDGSDIGDGEHVAMITIDGKTRYYDEPGCWQVPNDQCDYIPTGDRDAAPARDKKEDR